MNRFRSLLFLSLCFVFNAKAFAVTAWVSPNGQASWANAQSQTPLANASACNLASANANAQPGDMIYMRGGTYNNGQYINPANSGTSESARITFGNYNYESATITAANYGILLDGKSYITVNGINFNNLRIFTYIRNAGHHNTIGYCNFNQRSAASGSWQGACIFENSTHNRIHHCAFYRWAYGAANAHSGSLLNIGNDQAAGDDSSYNLVEDSIFAYAGHDTISVRAKFNVIRNNFTHNEPWDFEGYRAATTEGPSAGFCLWEGNRFGYAGQAPDGGSGMTFRSSNNIFRHNTSYGAASGMQVVCNRNDSTGLLDHAHYNHFYNNSFYHNGYGVTYAGFQGGIFFSNWSGHSPTGNVVKSNIFYHNNSGASNCNSDGSICHDGTVDSQIIENNWNNQTDPLFADLSDNGPVDPAVPDFHLQNNSPCIDTGGFLTTITSDDGSGTQFIVQDAGYFMDGWGIDGVQGDEVQLAGSSVRTRITSVSYDTNIITVNPGISWTKGMGVSLVFEGSAPDIGAYEYCPMGDCGGVPTPVPTTKPPARPRGLRAR